MKTVRLRPFKGGGVTIFHISRWYLAIISYFKINKAKYFEIVKCPAFFLQASRKVGPTYLQNGPSLQNQSLQLQILKMFKELVHKKSNGFRTWVKMGISVSLELWNHVESSNDTG